MQNESTSGISLITGSFLKPEEILTTQALLISGDYLRLFLSGIECKRGQRETAFRDAFEMNGKSNCLKIDQLSTHPQLDQGLGKFTMVDI